jgi:lactate dehydrogenase-like 2-hydroxyacid dehydrogenase
MLHCRMPKPPILAAMPLSAPLRARLEARYTLHGPPAAWRPEAIPAEARAARAIITLGGLVNDAAMQAAFPELGLIACYGTGFEGVDRAAAAARGIQVTHAGDANATSVAEFAFGLVIATARHMLRGDRLVRDGGWRSLTIERMPLTPGLAGKRLGIYGLGAIGQRIATRAAAFEMTVGYHNRNRRADLPYDYLPTLPALAEWADVLVVAVRAGPENAHAIDADILRRLGAQGILVNISRGLVVDEAALAAALEQGVIAGAGLDVFEHEPNVPERLRALPNTVLTPHMAALTQLAQGTQQDVLVATLAAFFAGQPLASLVPPP